MARERVPKMVAVVEDDESYRLAMQRFLKSAGFSVRSFQSAEDFLNSGCQQETGCLIADIRMPGMSGLDLQAMRGGAVKFLAKPFDGAVLLEGVRAALGSEG